MTSTISKYLPFSLSLGALALFVVGGRIGQLGEAGAMKMGAGAAWFCGQPDAASCNAPAAVPPSMLTQEHLGMALAGAGFLLVALAWGMGLVQAAQRRQWDRFASRLIVLPLLTAMALIGVIILMDVPFAPSILLTFVALTALIYGWVDRAPAKAAQPTPVEATASTRLAAQ
jgi:hypothetical protein